MMAAQGFLKLFLDLMRMPITENSPYKQAVQVVSLTSKNSYMLPAYIRQIRVVSGTAWVSYGTQDLVLSWGQRTTFLTDHTVVLTSLSNRPVVVELIL